MKCTINLEWTNEKIKLIRRMWRWNIAWTTWKYLWKHIRNNKKQDKGKYKILHRHLHIILSSSYTLSPLSPTLLYSLPPSLPSSSSPSLPSSLSPSLPLPHPLSLTSIQMSSYYSCTVYVSSPWPPSHTTQQSPSPRKTMTYLCISLPLILSRRNWFFPLSHFRPNRPSVT